MPRYEDDEYEGYDDYEDEERDEEVEEYEEEEERQPTAEEIEFLELRERIKERIRKDMKGKNSSANSKSLEKKRKLPSDNYGSFFGPSKPVIAQRVIQESKSILENQHLAERVLSSHRNVLVNKKSSSSAGAVSKNVVRQQLPKATSAVQKKIQNLKATRDYSFLLSDDADIPAPSREPAQRNVAAPKSEARPSAVPQKNKQPPSNSSKHMHGGHEERKAAVRNDHMPSKEGSRNGLMHSKEGSRNGLMHSKEGSRNGLMHSKEGSRNGQMHSKEGSRNGQMHSKEGYRNGQMLSKEGYRDGQMHSKVGYHNGQMHSKEGYRDGQMHSKEGYRNGQMHSKEGSYRQTSTSKPNSLSADLRRQPSSNNGIGPGRPSGSKSLHQKTPVASVERRASTSGTKSILPASQRPLSKLQPPVPRRYPDQRKETPEPYIPKMMPKQQLTSTKYQINRPAKHVTSSASLQDRRPKKKPIRQCSDDEDALSMIRSMFRTDRWKNRDEPDDDSDMEAGFEDIMKEERISAKIARKEDEEQLRLIEEEERQERQRKLKKRKV